MARPYSQSGGVHDRIKLKPSLGVGAVMVVAVDGNRTSNISSDE